MGSVRIATLAAVTAFALSGFAVAVPPAVGISITVDGGVPAVFNPVGVGGPGVYNYTGNGFRVGWLSTWNFNAANSTETSPTFLSGNFTFVNNSGADQIYDVLVSLATTAAGPSTLMGGSVAGGLTVDADGGTLSAWNANTPVWNAYVGNTEVAGLLTGATTSAGAFGSSSLGNASFGNPIPNLAGPAMTTEMSIRLRFVLTPGDQASFTSVFVLEVVPSPAALSLFGIAALVGRRRRN